MLSLTCGKKKANLTSFKTIKEYIGRRRRGNDGGILVPQL